MGNYCFAITGFLLQIKILMPCVPMLYLQSVTMTIKLENLALVKQAITKFQKLTIEYIPKQVKKVRSLMDIVLSLLQTMLFNIKLTYWIYILTP